VGKELISEAVWLDLPIHQIEQGGPGKKNPPRETSGERGKTFEESYKQEGGKACKRGF